MAGTPIRTQAEILRAYFSGETLRIALYDDTTAFTFDEDAHEFVADVLDGGTTAQELQGSSGYTGSGDRQTLQNVTITEDNTDGEAELDADDVTWNSVSSTADIQGFIIYRQVGGDDTTPGDDEIVYVLDDDMPDAPASLPATTNGENVIVTFDAEGIFNTVVTT